MKLVLVVLLTVFGALSVQASDAYVLRSRKCADGSKPRDGIIDKTAVLNLKNGSFSLAGAMNPGTSQSIPFIISAKADLTSTELVLSEVTTFYAGEAAPQVSNDPMVMKRIGSSMSFILDSNHSADGACHKGVMMLVKFVPALK